MIVIGGSASMDLAKELASVMGCDYIQAATTTFPDGECYTRIDAEKLDDDVVIVQTTSPDSKLIELLLLQDAVRRLGAKSITLVIPYFGYARQDRVFKPGEPESAKVMCQHLDMNCDRVITVDIHKEAVLNYFNHPHKDLKAAPVKGRASTWSSPPTSVRRAVPRWSGRSWASRTTIWRRPASPVRMSALHPPRQTSKGRRSSSWTT